MIAKSPSQTGKREEKATSKGSNSRHDSIRKVFH
jgi:hypothetical protein